MLSLRLVLGLLWLGVSSVTRGAACSNKAVVFNFGDSNSDTGGDAVLIGLLLPAAENGRLFFEHPTGRLCDGRLILDFLCESLGSSYLTPYFTLSAPEFSNGVNFALGGSDTLRPPEAITTLATQVNQLKFFRNTTHYLEDHEFRSALYMVDIGQNDITGFFNGNRTIDGVRNLIPLVISKIREAMQDIYKVGGRNFWVHNTGPLGCLPSKRNASSQVVDSYGCIAELNQAAREFNAQLNRLCQELRSEMVGSTVVYVDVFSIKLGIIVNYSSYGFGENPWVPCLSSSSVCRLGSRRVFWDAVHYTEAANAIVASQIASTHFSTPPLPINFFCN